MQRIRDRMSSCIFDRILLTQKCRANKSINATYAIDPARNAGMDFQYDEVVRRKDDRRKMDAGDCECCRDVSSFMSTFQPTNDKPIHSLVL